MDPNANLSESLTLADDLANDPEASDGAARLAELVLSLNEWITRGGFLPDTWRQSGPWALK